MSSCEREYTTTQDGLVKGGNDGWKNHFYEPTPSIEGLEEGRTESKNSGSAAQSNSPQHPRTPREAATGALKKVWLGPQRPRTEPERAAGSASSHEPGPIKSLWLLAVSGKSRRKASGRLAWPPQERGVHIAVCDSPHACYSVVVGLSKWALSTPFPGSTSAPSGD